MKLQVRLQLSTMMFLQFFIWGCWYATMGTYLFKVGFSGLQVGASFSTVNWGAILSPFIIGMVADRFFSAEKVMAIIHLAGAGILWYLSSITDPGIFFWTLLLYSILYMPTLALANAISFYQMEDTEKEFPTIRVLGTLGWIAAGTAISFMNYEDSHLQFQLASLLSVVLGIFSFFLPNTPPKSKGRAPNIRDVLGLDTLMLMKNRSFAIFIISSLLISIPLAFYYSFTNPFLNDMGMENAAFKMTFGQWSEIIFLLLMPFFFMRLGIKKMMLIGMLAWLTRYLLFAYGNADDLVFMYYIAIILHGICFDFFFVTGQIYVDKAAPKEIQASAQGFIALITYGVGMLIGSWASGWFVDHYTTADGNRLWQSIWLIPAAMAMVISVLFFIFFNESPNEDMEIQLDGSELS